MQNTSLSRLGDLIWIWNWNLNLDLDLDLEQGAVTQCYLALHPDAKEVSGKYWCDSNLYEPSDKAKDTELGKKLWDYTLDLVA
jgi:hypothetical protein